MTKPATTTTNYNTTTTTTTKPSTMETIKDKAATLVDKVTGKHHDGTHHTSHTTHTTDVHNPSGSHNNHAHNGPLHTGAAAAGAAVPHDVPADRAAYQQQPGAPANSIPVTGQQHHGHNANADPNLVHPSVIPHGQTTTTTTTSAAGTHIPAGGHHSNIQHPAPAGPTGTTNVPTYAQNIPPTAAGVVPTAYTAEQVHDPNHHNHNHDHSKHDNNHHNGGGLLHRHHDDKNVTGATGHGVPVSGGVPVNTNNSTVPVNNSNIHQAAPVHTDNNTVPAMGAPGTTTAAGTHMPGGFNNNNTQHHYGHDGSVVPPPVPSKNNNPAPVL
ncbi:hypothetical protein BGZ72_005298 [Mortierella alpina]|nr:hypothetical protein BGZ72_005298 [Mortierella alpina]